MNSADAARQNYIGNAGKSYLDQRRGATSDRIQSLRARIFEDIGKPDRTILDFGCGTGGILSRLSAHRRIGVDVGEEARAEAASSGIEVHQDLRELPDDSVDAAISFHAIEHVSAPLEIIEQLRRVVKAGGILRLVVPGENPRDPRQSQWQPNEDMHLYTWTPLLFGNLAYSAGLRNFQTRIEPMPTGSRIVRAATPIPFLERALHHRVASRLNAWNVILDAEIE